VAAKYTRATNTIRYCIQFTTHFKSTEVDWRVVRNLNEWHYAWLSRSGRLSDWLSELERISLVENIPLSDTKLTVQLQLRTIMNFKRCCYNSSSDCNITHTSRDNTRTSRLTVSRPSNYRPSRWTHCLEQSSGQCDCRSVAVDFSSASVNLFDLDLISWHHPGHC